MEKIMTDITIFLGLKQIPVSAQKIQRSLEGQNRTNWLAPSFAMCEANVRHLTRVKNNKFLWSKNLGSEQNQTSLQNTTIFKLMDNNWNWLTNCLMPLIFRTESFGWFCRVSVWTIRWVDLSNSHHFREKKWQINLSNFCLQTQNCWN